MLQLLGLLPPNAAAVEVCVGQLWRVIKLDLGWVWGEETVGGQALGSRRKRVPVACREQSLML